MKLWGKAIPLFLALALLGMGCGIAETLSHPQTIQPATAIVSPLGTVTIALPTLAPNPSATPTPGPTAEAALKTNGPYLAYIRGVDVDHEQLVLMDANGMGRKVISMPSENPLYTWFVSPDGKWLAYYAGSAKKEKASDLELDLLNLETGQTQVVSKLLSKDYPDNFDAAIKELKSADSTASISADELEQAFNEGITHAIGWSPDGKYLAFAGQMDGSSSDVYLYDLAKGSFRRISQGPQEIQGIDWSPDGKWIFSASTMQFGEGVVYDEDAIAFGSFTHKSLPYQTGGWEWYSNHAYIMHDSSNGPGDFNLQSVDIEKGNVQKIWGGSFENLVIDPEQKLLIFFASSREWPPSDETNFVPGTYLIDLKTGKEMLAYAGRATPSFFGLGNRRFLINADTDTGSEAYFIKSDGTLIPADPTINYASVAPDKQHWVGIGKTLKIFNADNSLAFDIPLPFTPSGSPYDFHMLWKPNSSGLFIMVGTEIYSVDIQSKEIHLVEGNLLPYQNLNFIAIPAK